jgi:general secretion pathway protein D
MTQKLLELDAQRPRSFALLWIRILSVSCAVISLIGILSLFSSLALSADPPGRGFEGGGKTFTNPFAAPPSTDPFFEDELEEEEAGTGSGAFTGGSGGGPKNIGDRPSIRVGGGRNQNDVPDPRRGAKPGAIIVGGDAGGGVISNTDIRQIAIDPDSGAGGKEVITDFNFPDADIMDIAKTLGKLTGKNFILDNNVKGRVTIISNSPITVADAWRAFLTALDINQFALIPSGKHLRIARQRDARDKQVSTYVGENSPATDALITRIFALKFISAEEVARVFRSFTSGNSRIIPYEQTNSVIVTDTGANISKLAKMLDFLDVEGFDAGIEVIQVKYASAVEISRLIDTLLPGTQAGLGNARPGGARPAAPMGRGSTFSARRTKEGGIINNVIADERTNNLIVHANTKGVEQVQELVRRLDKKVPAPTGGGKIHVVYLQFADAEEIGKTLNALSQGGARTGGGGFGFPPPGGGGVGVNPTETVLFEGQIKVSPDKTTNSLVITASPSDFATVQRVISKLDIPRDEVYVEAVIMEMSVNRDFNFSSAIAGTKPFYGFVPNGDLAGYVNPATQLTQTGFILPFGSGNKVDVNVGGTTQKIDSVLGLIKVLQTNAKANIVATPQILTLDNKEATFESNEKIPVPTSSVSTTGTTTSLTKEDVGLSITIKPQINKISNFVKLDIKTKLADFSGRQLPAAVASLGLATIDRRVDTSVVIADKDTVVLGGLVRDKQTETVAKVPILGDIPVLGWLFRSRETQMQKTNLLIFITPHIVRQYEKVRALLDRKLKERDDFIEKSAGGNDAHREYRDEMIRRLPDMQEILNYKPSKDFTLNDESEPTENNDGRPFSEGSKSKAPPPAPFIEPSPAPITNAEIPTNQAPTSE